MTKEDACWLLAGKISTKNIIVINCLFMLRDFLYAPGLIILLLGALAYLTIYDTGIAIYIRTAVYSS